MTRGGRTLVDTLDDEDCVDCVAEKLAVFRHRGPHGYACHCEKKE